MRYLGIDPSVNNVGIAFYDDETDELVTATFHPKRLSETTSTQIAVQIVRYILIQLLQGRKRADYIVLEHPQWEDSQRGNQAAAKGYTLDLAFLVGYIAGSMGLAATKTFTPTPLEWKGNMPKTAVESRFKKRWPKHRKVSDHEFEAAMMIDWMISQLK